MAVLFCWVFNEAASYLSDGVDKQFVDYRKVVDKSAVAREDALFIFSSHSNRLSLQPKAKAWPTYTFLAVHLLGREGVIYPMFSRLKLCFWWEG